MKEIKVKPKESKVLKAILERGKQCSSSSVWTQSHSVHSNHNKNSR